MFVFTKCGTVVISSWTEIWLHIAHSDWTIAARAYSQSDLKPMCLSVMSWLGWERSLLGRARRASVLWLQCTCGWAKRTQQPHSLTARSPSFLSLLPFTIHKAYYLVLTGYWSRTRLKLTAYDFYTSLSVAPAPNDNALLLFLVIFQISRLKGLLSSLFIFSHYVLVYFCCFLAK